MTKSGVGSRATRCMWMMVVVTALGCAENPATGKRQFSLVPKSQEIAMGKQAAEEVAMSVGLVQNEALQRYVTGVGQKLMANAERQELPWSFQVVDDPAVNAFALPGGYTFVTRGILAHMNNEAQLAAVMGHEIAHVTAKHSVSQISKAQLAQLGLGVGMLLSENVRRFGQAGVVGLNLLFLKFGRDAENQADELGFKYAHKSGYDMREMSAVFATLERVGGGGEGRLPEWMSTHPNPENRIAKTNTRVAQAQVTGGTVAAAEYLRKIDGIVFGPNPREGFFQGNRYLHPELKFTVAFPSNWKYANLKQAVIAASPEQDAIIQVAGTKHTDPAAALREFMSQQGVQAAGAAGRVASPLPSAAQPFTAAAEEGTIAGLASFIAHEGHVYMLLEFTPAAKMATYGATFTQVPATFAPLTDPAALAVQPAVLKVQSAPRAMTLAQLYQERPASVPVETIALINQLQPATALTAGQPVKWVTGGVKQPGSAPISSLR
jgi:predicted Zn-dependent protease